MSYTPPAPTAADFSFTGGPASGATGFSWNTLGRTQAASGFIGTQFGAHAAVYLKIAQAAGTTVTTFGSPTHVRGQLATSTVNVSLFGSATSARSSGAVGFQSFNPGTPTYKIDWQVTKFGQARLFPFHVAPGWQAAQFGEPTAATIKRVPSLGWVVSFGIPASPTIRSLSASGFLATRFGVVFNPPTTAPNLSQVQQAYGSSSTLLGTPVASPQQFGSASGFSSTFVQSPSATPVLPAAGFALTVFGQASCAWRTHAAGLSTARLGSPVSRLALSASSTYRSTRWGSPLTVRSDTYIAAGWLDTRFGQPDGTLRFNKQATGFCTTTLGVPACRRQHRASMLAPATSFGSPLLKRTSQC